MLEVRVFNAGWEHLAPRLDMDLAGRDLSVAALLTELGLEPAEVGIVTVDGRQSTPDEALPGTGRVCIFPPMMGG